MVSKVWITDYYVENHKIEKKIEKNIHHIIIIIKASCLIHHKGGRQHHDANQKKREKTQHETTN
jgi:hypothetical protein